MCCSWQSASPAPVQSDLAISASEANGSRITLAYASSQTCPSAERGGVTILLVGTPLPHSAATAAAAAAATRRRHQNLSPAPTPPPPPLAHAGSSRTGMSRRDQGHQGA